MSMTHTISKKKQIRSIRICFYFLANYTRLLLTLIGRKITADCQ